jgi:hypothetical protein
MEENEAKTQEVEQPAAEPATGEAKATDTLEFWKAQARRNETTMKANKRELDALKAQLQGSKSVEDRLTALETENAALKAAKARADLVREVATATGLQESIVASLNGVDADALTAQARAVASIRVGAAPVADEAGRKQKAPAVSRESIMAIDDKRERRAAIAANPGLFRK